jgi:hypothetical protein
VGGAEIFIHKSEIIGAVKLLSNGEAVTYELGTVMVLEWCHSDVAVVLQLCYYGVANCCLVGRR